MGEDRIRLAEAADTDAVKAVIDAAFTPWTARIGAVPVPMEADHAAQVAAGQVFVTGDPVTGLLVVEAHEDHLYLDTVAVHPHAQGTGVGRRLLEFAEARARGLGLPEIRLFTHELMRENRELYRAFGYEAAARPAGGNDPRVHFRKRLD